MPEILVYLAYAGFFSIIGDGSSRKINCFSVTTGYYLYDVGVGNLLRTLEIGSERSHLIVLSFEFRVLSFYQELGQIIDISRVKLRLIGLEVHPANIVHIGNGFGDAVGAAFVLR
ncbi:hypothetical protein ES703_119474 [subsurface metagenome]